MFTQFAATLFALFWVAAYYVVIFGGYLCLCFLLLRLSWRFCAATRLKYLSTGLALLLALWYPVGSPILSYVRYQEQVALRGGAHVLRTVADVDRVYLRTKDNLHRDLALRNRYDAVETNNNMPEGNYRALQGPPQREGPLESSADLLIRAIPAPTAQYVVTRLVNTLATGVSCNELVISTTDGEELGTHGSVTWWGSGLMLFWSPKKMPLYARFPEDPTASELAFIETVLQPRHSAAPPPAPK